MFFVLSKTIGFFVWATNSCLALGLLGLLLMPTRFARVGRQLLAASVLILLFYGIWPLGIATALLIEQRFPKWGQAGGPPVDGIVVLGGAINARLSLLRGTISLNAQAERMTVIADLARRYPKARIVFSGGDAHLLLASAAEADFVLPLWESFGIARDRVVLENRSRNTAENASFSKARAEPKSGERWLLVTSALHMPRAIGAFRRAAFPVEAYPVDWRTVGWQDLVTIPGTSLAVRLATTDLAAREAFGLLIYWLTGQSSELLPGPGTPSLATAGQDDRRP